MPFSITIADAVIETGFQFQHLFPAEFVSLHQSVKDKPGERSLWLAFADWCDENDEPVIASGCRFLGESQDTKLVFTQGKWRFLGLPEPIRKKMGAANAFPYPAKAVVHLGRAVPLARAEVQKMLEKLK